MTEECPCHSGKSYASCCRPFIEKETFPPTCVELMRSRFTAYSLNKSQYIIDTTLPARRKKENNMWKKEIEKFSDNTNFVGLNIEDIHHYSDELATVTFHAHLTEDGNDCSFTEKSLFRKLDGQWFYDTGEILK